MKCAPILSAISILGLVGCETMNQPISSSDFDPLRPPGGNIVSAAPSSSKPAFSAGQFVRAAMANTAFYKKKPSGDGDADKLLKRDTSMKVISMSGSYVKVELDSGDVGFVPSVMVEDAATSPTVAKQKPGELQVYPPLPTKTTGPLPIIDPSGLPPDGAIPTVIDPEAPSVLTPVPAATTPKADSFTTPAPVVGPIDVTPAMPVTPAAPSAPDAPVAPTASVPLPPNEEDLKAMKKTAEEKAQNVVPKVGP